MSNFFYEYDPRVNNGNSNTRGGFEQYHSNQSSFASWHSSPAEWTNTGGNNVHSIPDDYDSFDRGFGRHKVEYEVSQHWYASPSPSVSSNSNFPPGNFWSGTDGDGYYNSDRMENYYKLYYSQNDMINAVDAVRRGSLTVLGAAKKYRIPSRTLYDRLGKLGISLKMCRKRKGFYNKQVEYDCCVSWSALRRDDSVNCERLKRNTSFTRNGGAVPYENWETEIGLQFYPTERQDADSFATMASCNERVRAPQTPYATTSTCDSLPERVHPVAGANAEHGHIHTTPVYDHSGALQATNGLTKCGPDNDGEYFRTSSTSYEPHMSSYMPLPESGGRDENNGVQSTQMTCSSYAVPHVAPSVPLQPKLDYEECYQAYSAPPTAKTVSFPAQEQQLETDSHDSSSSPYALSSNLVSLTNVKHEFELKACSESEREEVEQSQMSPTLYTSVSTVDSVVRNTGVGESSIPTSPKSTMLEECFKSNGTNDAAPDASSPETPGLLLQSQREEVETKEANDIDNEGNRKPVLAIQEELIDANECASENNFERDASSPTPRPPVVPPLEVYLRELESKERSKSKASSSGRSSSPNYISSITKSSGKSGQKLVYDLGFLRHALEVDSKTKLDKYPITGEKPQGAIAEDSGTNRPARERISSSSKDAEDLWYWHSETSSE